MRKLLLLIELLVCVNSYSQTNVHYKTILSDLEHDSQFSRVITKHATPDVYYIQADYKEGLFSSMSYYFVVGIDNSYTKIISGYTSNLNKVVNSLNRVYVKLDEFKWKDYANNSTLVLTIDKELFVITVVRDS